ncbi:DNA repair XRCC2 [Pelobates cultripes]|uniref:DNA repair XRCC2 n=1 Tax=Pelobates cultripes TaxID=61616 RepID=A0AAD1VZ57_PELCU|nr:DNA repair XRCC2 [Pelobates cultripes]
MADGYRKAESGTQLLARLEGRASLKDLEPLIFADEEYPVHAKHSPLDSGQLSLPGIIPLTLEVLSSIYCSYKSAQEKPDQKQHVSLQLYKVSKLVTNSH